MSDFSHFDEHGASRMVDVSGKAISERMARASAVIRMQPATLERIQQRSLAKGDVLEVARLAGIMAAKRTSELIPLCHLLPLDGVAIDFELVDASSLRIEARAKSTGRTGVEMEALVAATICGLTIYDMCKSVDRTIEIDNVRLEEKSGGKSGHFVRDNEARRQR